MPIPAGRETVAALPERIAACLFDLDGVLVQTARLHAAAWKRTFDAFLAERAAGSGEESRPFELPEDYVAHVDGRLREDGVRSFLDSRGIAADAETVTAIAERKNDLVLTLLEEEGVEVYAGSIRFVEAVRAAGLARAVVSASRNTRAVLDAAGIAGLFEVVVDGVVAGREGLAGKPSPDTFLAAADALGVEPARAAVFEDALAGVEAGRAGSFGYVVGVDRGAGAEALRAHGADVVVDDLAELEVWR
jgi:beta-phosphoglucomutase family hydrolase